MNQDEWERTLGRATAHIALDARLRSYTILFPVPALVPHDSYHKALVESIISQQLSVKAAASITKRFLELFDGTFPTPEQISLKGIEQLRSAGLSGQKAGYIQDLALRMVEGSLHLDDIQSRSNEEIVTMLTEVKGIGEWTAHMFMIFSLGRLDVLPCGDLGIRNGIMQLYGYDHLPNAEEVKDTAVRHNWHPYESVASWYIWKSLNNEPNKT